MNEQNINTKLNILELKIANIDTRFNELEAMSKITLTSQTQSVVTSITSDLSLLNIINGLTTLKSGTTNQVDLTLYREVTKMVFTPQNDSFFGETGAFGFSNAENTIITKIAGQTTTYTQTIYTLGQRIVYSNDPAVTGRTAFGAGNNLSLLVKSNNGGTPAGDDSQIGNGTRRLEANFLTSGRNIHTYTEGFISCIAEVLTFRLRLTDFETSPSFINLSVVGMTIPTAFVGFPFKFWTRTNVRGIGVSGSLYTTMRIEIYDPSNSQIIYTRNAPTIDPNVGNSVTVDTTKAWRIDPSVSFTSADTANRLTSTFAEIEIK
jgi:hypothetical protein